MNRKKIGKMYGEPERDFNAWAQENNLELREERPKIKAADKSVLFRKIAFVAAPFVVVFAILLPLLSFFGGQQSPSQDLPRYAWNEVVRQEISIDELLAYEDLIPLNFQDAEFNQINKVSAFDNASLLLGFNINDAYIPVQSGNDFFVVKAEITIRTYKNYEFAGLSSFTKLNDSFSVGNLKIDYRMEQTGWAAYLKNECEYFFQIFEVDGFEGLTEIRFKAFLENLLG